MSSRLLCSLDGKYYHKKSKSDSSCVEVGLKRTLLARHAEVHDTEHRLTFGRPLWGNAEKDQQRPCAKHQTRMRKFFIGAHRVAVTQRYSTAAAAEHCCHWLDPAVKLLSTA
jgi:hypothetical protein